LDDLTASTLEKTDYFLYILIILLLGYGPYTASATFSDMEIETRTVLST
jgi:hypothetical protein